MDRSKFLAKVIGLYCLIVSLVMLTHMGQFAASLQAFINNTPLMFFAGFVVLIMGLLLVVSHNVWEWHWRTLITVVGWIVLLKGISLLFWAECMSETAVYFVEHTTFAYVVAGVDLLLGAVLCYFGFGCCGKCKTDSSA